MRALLLLLGLVVAATGITPFDLTGLDIGADHAGELTLTIIVIIGMFFAIE